MSNANYFYEPIRVDINSKGKIRARKINYIQATEVKQLTYPLKFKAKAPFKYFQIRETWKVTDFIFNPMVLMMVLPLFFIMVLPKMMNPNDLNESQKVYFFSLLVELYYTKFVISRNCKIYLRWTSYLNFLK